MSAPPELIHIVRQWVQKAENDLRNAEHTLSLSNNCPYDTICFHAQQCIEKYLKAVLIFNGDDSPKTHDIGELVRQASKNCEIGISAAQQERLTDYAVASRYPIDTEPITRLEASEAVDLAKRVRLTVRNYLSSKGAIIDQTRKPIP